jgi:polysaccharide chain length determinant protein (PEP-CTERM system associated)
MEDSHVHALDYLSVLRRRRWWLLTPVIASILVGLALVKYLPREYRSSATLAVAAPTVSPDLISQSVSFDNQERLRALSQLLLSPKTLARVAREERLAADGAQDEAVARLRRSIGIEVPDPVASTGGPRRLDTVVVSYQDESPERAQRIASRLTTVFIDENNQARADFAENTSAFIASQLRASQARLAALEERVRASKEAYMGQLPEQLQANLQTLAGLRQQLEANATALRGEQDRLSFIDQQLAEMRQGNPAAFAAASGGVDGDSASPESRIQTLQRELVAAQTTYTDRHPEVQRLRRELARARREAADAERQAEPERLAQLRVDPAYQRLMAERDAAALRVRDFQRTIADGQRQIQLYQQRVETTPRVEQQLSSVQRDYDLEKEQYAALSSRLHTSRISENVERNRSSEQFTVLYGASYPTTPVKPVPFRVMVMSILAGICLGAALTLGREYLDRSVHEARQLTDQLGVPVLGEISRIHFAQAGRQS